MQYKKVSGGYFIKIEKGEEVLETLTKFCKDNNLKSGSISGIGGTNDVSIKYYDMEKKEYLPINFGGKNYEIISLNGNISLVEGKPFVHLHIMIGDSDYRTFGGHLGKAVVGLTAEIMINMTEDIIERKLDEKYNLNFWEF